MIVLDLPQGSEEWKAARAGKVTASRIADVLAKVKSGEAASRADYRAQLVAEILTGHPQESGYVNDDMRWGTEQEPFARVAYEVETNQIVDQVGLVLHPTIDRAAASPDGVIYFAGEPEGLIEIKCPKTATHLNTLVSGEIPTKYVPQMLWQMACTGAKWCDFVSFDPRLPKEYQLFKKRLERDPKRISEIEGEVLAFLATVDETLAALERRAA